MFIDYHAYAFYQGTGLKYPVQDTFWTMDTPELKLGKHELSFACYDSGFEEGGYILAFPAEWEDSAIWKDDGFSFNNTDPPIPTEVPVQHAGPGYVLETSSGAPAGPNPCPAVDATPWRTVRIAFYDWGKEEWLYPENKYTLSDPLVAELTALPFQIPISANQGDYIGITAECNRPANVLGAFEAGFTFYANGIVLDVPAGGPLSLRELAAGGHNPAEKCISCFLSKIMSFGWPVDASTGNFWHSFTDFSIPGRGFPLDLSRTYNSVNANLDGPFGFGWAFPYGMSLAFPDSTTVVINQENGSQVTFTEQEDGSYTAPPRVNGTLVHNGNGTWKFIRQKQEIFTFTEDGKLTQESDLNGNATSLAYNGDGKLASVTDPSGRSLDFTYTGDHIASVTDPLNREVNYTYDEAGNLIDFTDARGRNTHFTYDSSHRLLTMRLPNQEPGAPGSTESVISNTYDSQGRVTSQTDQLGRTTTFSYSGEPLGEKGGATMITDPRGGTTVQEYQFGELLSDTKGYETPQEASWSFEYDLNTLGMTRITDPNGRTTSNSFDSEGNLLTTTDQLGHTTTYTYDELSDRTSETNPAGTTTSYRYDSAGNLLEKKTPLEGTGEAARTTYSYEGAPGELTAMTNPDGHVTHFGYDANGNRTSVTDADGNETTYVYNADGEQTSMVSPIGNEGGGNPTAHTTSYAYNANGELTSETDQLGNTTSYTYDGNGNRTSVTDANGHKTKQIYDADNELVEVIRPNGSTLKTKWDAAGNMTAQTDAAGHTTSYVYDSLNRLTSTTDPDGHTTAYAYDPAGNKVETINAEGESTYYEYDEANELASIKYSNGTTPRVYMGYDEDGNRIWLEDGTGESSFTYDSLNRMTSATDGAGATVGYEYDLAGRLISLTYPNGKAVARKYDPAGDLTSVADWLGHTTKFSYSADSNLEKELHPNGVETQRTYDNADRLASITDTKDATQLAAFNYTRDAAGQLASESAENGGNEAVGFTRNSLDQLTAANTTPYGYDNADNPTTFGNETTQQFDPANELTSVMSPGETVEEEAEEEGEESKEEPEEKGGGGKEQGGGSKEPPEEHERPVEPPTVDAKSIARLRKPGRLVSRKLHVQQGDLLIAFVSAASRHQHVRRVNGGGLHWSRVARQGGAGGISEAWQARTSRAFSGRVTVTLARRARLATAAIAAFGNDAFVAVHSVGHGRHSTPLDRINAPAGALLWGVGNSFGQSRPPVPAPGQSVVSRFFSRRAGLSGWVQNADGSGGATALSTRSRASRWSLLGLAVTSAAQAGASRATASPAGGAHSATTTNPVTSAASIVTRNFSYNERGDRVAEEVAEGATRNLEYDQADRLVGVDGNIEYAYNGDGLRTSKTVNGIATGFVWNQAEPLPELLQDGSTYYVYGPEGQPIEQITGTTPTYLHGDQQGSTRLLTNGSGSVVGRYDYNPWGGVAAHSGSATTNLQYDDQYTDGETGYQYLRARYYDPATGQFLTVDPAFSFTLTRYTFTLNDPLDGGDPTGLFCVLGHNPNGSCRGSNVTNDLHAVGTAASVTAIAAGVVIVSVGSGGTADIAAGVAVGAGAVGTGADCLAKWKSFSCGFDAVTLGVGTKIKGVANGAYTVITGGIGLVHNLWPGKSSSVNLQGARTECVGGSLPFQQTLPISILQPALGASSLQ